MLNGKDINQIIKEHGEGHLRNLKLMYEEMVSGRNRAIRHDQLGEVNLE